jgi:multidrug efflux pump subunit AcrB
MGLRNGLLVGATVVLSIVLVFGVLPFVHVDVNQISILALIIALGVIVDAGIVSVDNVERKLRSGASREEAARAGIGELWLPLLTSTLVAMTSFLPFRLMGGSVGDFVRDLAVVTSNALLMSLLVAYFITPLLAERFARSAKADESATFASRVRAVFDGGLDRLRAVYAPFARAALHRPVLTVGLAFAGVIAAAASIPALGVQFFPSADRDQFFISVTAPDGTDIRATAAIVARGEQRLAQEHDITSYGAFIGRGAPRFYYNVTSEQTKPSYAQIIVNTVDVPAANRLVERLRPALATIPGARIEVKKLEQGPPVGAPIQIRLASEHKEDLPAAAAALREKLRAVPGAIAVRDSLGEASTAIAVDIDPQRAASAGVSEATVRQLLATAYGGNAPTSVRESDRQTPIVVRLPAEMRTDASALGGLGVRSEGGAIVPLAEIATIRLATQTSVATLRDGLPTVIVSAETVGRLPSAVLAEAQEGIRNLALPAGTTVAYAGEDEQTAKSFRNLLTAALVGLLLNQIILLWEFRSLRTTLVVLAAVPLGLIGAVAGLALTGNHFGFVASLGLASLGGIVTYHTIVLFEYARREIEEHPGIAMDEALIQAGQQRLRPILLTVVTSIAALLPLAFSAQSLWRPFCWVVIFGLATSVVMTLVVIPALYRLVYGARLRLPLWARRGTIATSR